MQQVEVPRFSGLETNLPQNLSKFRQTASTQKSLASFEKEVWPLLKEVAAHLSGRWSNCKKMIVTGRLTELLTNHQDPDGSEIPESSIMHQHKRAAQLGSQALSAACYILIAEFCGCESKNYWDRVHAIHENLLESNYLNPNRRNLFLEAKNELSKLLRELKDRIYLRDGLIINSSDYQGLQLDEHESIHRKHRHQAVLSGLESKFHIIANGFNSLNFTYSTLLKSGLSYIAQLNVIQLEAQTQRDQLETASSEVPKDQLRLYLSEIEERLEHAKKELTSATIAKMKLEIPDTNLNVQSTRGLLRKHHFEGLLLAAGSTSLVDGPAQAIDFNLSSLYEIFEERRSLVPSLKTKNIELKIDLKDEVLECMNKIKIFHRAMLGWIFDNLILNSLQALGKSDIENSSIIIRASVSDERLNFEVISHYLIATQETIDQINSSISDYHSAKTRAKNGKGGNGFPDITRLLTHKSCLGSERPVVHNCCEGFCVSFFVDWQKL